MLQVLSRGQEAHLDTPSKCSPHGLLGADSVSKAQTITLNIWLLPQHELSLPLSPAHSIFKKKQTQKTLPSHYKCFSGNQPGGPIPFPKIKSAHSKGQRGGACRPFCKSFKYPGTDPIKRTNREGKTARPPPFFSLFLSLRSETTLVLAIRDKISFHRFNINKVESENFKRSSVIRSVTRSVTAESPRRSLGTAE